MSSHELQSLAHRISGLQHSIGDVNHRKSNADRAMANCNNNIIRLRNIQARQRDMNTSGAQRLRRDLTKWENEFRTASTAKENHRHTLERLVNDRRRAEERLRQLQDARRQMVVARGTGRGGRVGGGGRHF